MICQLSYWLAEFKTLIHDWMKPYLEYEKVPRPGQKIHFEIPFHDT